MSKFRCFILRDENATMRKKLYFVHLSDLLAKISLFSFYASKAMRVDGKQLNISNISFRENLVEKYTRQGVTATNKPDAFIKTQENTHSDNKFSVWEAGKNFLKGVISSVKAIIEHPVLSIGAIASTALACSVIPVLTPIMAVTFGLLSACQLAKGCIVAGKEYSNGNFDESEKAFQTIGQGTMGVATTMLGVRQNAKIVKEAKTMVSMKKTKLPVEIRHDISEKISLMSYKDAVKELLSLFTTKLGKDAIITQLKPFMIQARLQDMISVLSGKAFKTTKIVSNDELIEKFKQTPEGQRRAKLSDKQIETEIRRIYKEIFDEIGVSDADRPTLVIEKSRENFGGSYSPRLHTIKCNPNCYRNGMFDIEEVLRHEASHCQDYMLNAGFPESRRKEVVQNSLINKILNGEAEYIAKGPNGYNLSTMKSPKMSLKFREEFARFAENNLYHDNGIESLLRTYQQEKHLILENSGFANHQNFKRAEGLLNGFLSELKMLLENNPDFVAQYKNYDEALDVLADYCLAHQYRYNRILEIAPKSLPLTQDDVAYTVNALSKKVNEIDGTARVNEACVLKMNEDMFNHYSYSRDEVTAQTRGLNYLIKCLTKKLENKRIDSSSVPEAEQYLVNRIKTANLKIEERIKGQEYYEKYIELLNNPNNDVLKADVSRLKNEIAEIKLNFPKRQYKTLKYIDTAKIGYPLSYLFSFDFDKDKTAAK